MRWPMALDLPKTRAPTMDFAHVSSRRPATPIGACMGLEAELASPPPFGSARWRARADLWSWPASMRQLVIEQAPGVPPRTPTDGQACRTAAPSPSAAQTHERSPLADCLWLTVCERRGAGPGLDGTFWRAWRCDSGSPRIFEPAPELTPRCLSLGGLPACAGAGG